MLDGLEMEPGKKLGVEPSRDVEATPGFPPTVALLTLLRRPELLLPCRRSRLRLRTHRLTLYRSFLCIARLRRYWILSFLFLVGSSDFGYGPAYRFLVSRLIKIRAERRDDGLLVTSWHLLACRTFLGLERFFDLSVDEGVIRAWVLALSMGTVSSMSDISTA